jgi:nitrate reductase alpha subunit
MLTLSRGGPHVWISETDAEKANIEDNDWVEALNINGATVARVVVSQRIPDGMAMMYHAQEKNINVPGSNTTGKRGGILNSVKQWFAYLQQVYMYKTPHQNHASTDDPDKSVLVPLRYGKEYAHGY